MSTVVRPAKNLKPGNTIKMDGRTRIVSGTGYPPNTPAGKLAVYFYPDGQGEWVERERLIELIEAKER